MSAVTSDRLIALVLRAGLDLAYLAIGLATAIIAFAVWVTGVTVTLSLAVFVIGLPIFLLFAVAFRWTAELDRRNAALVRGRPLRGRYRDHRGKGFLGRLGSTAGDPQTWRDLLWLVLHSVIGFGFGVLAVSLVAQTLATAVLPLWFWADPGGVEHWPWTVNTLPEALATMLLAIPLGALTVGVLRAMAIGEAALAATLLEARGAEAAPAGARADRRQESRVDGGAVLALYASLTALIGMAVTVVWFLTGRGPFWPGWVWLGLGLPIGLYAGVRYAAAGRGPGPRRRLAVHGAISGAIGAACVFAWVLSGSSYFWAIWPLLGLGLLLAIDAVFVAFWERVAPGAREQELVERVGELTRTRRGALDVQAAELRRIERDLHDGAQARLVALTMKLGRAEERLADQPAVADLVREARGEASAAIAELRDLARGIAPPVLADRGLEAAVEALARRAPIPVTVDAKVERRPPPVIETAAYFVVAESLTNAAKHAGGASARVWIRDRRGRLMIAVTDEGRGGADPGGGGLTGLRHRVEALDGTLNVTSPSGAGTIVRAELPAG
jgi:signal transduction histidine kinase